MNLRQILILSLIFFIPLLSSADSGPFGNFFSQDSQKLRLQELRENCRKLNVQLKMDKNEYLAGEDGKLTISIVNPTSDPLEVLEPFSNKTGGLMLLIRDLSNPHNKNGVEWVSPLADISSYVDKEPPVVIVKPGEFIERRFDLSFTNRELWIHLFGGMPAKPGEYRLEYSYGGKPVEFRVIAPPKLESWTRLKLPRTAEFKEKGRVVKIGMYSCIVGIDDQGEHIIVVSRTCSRSNQDLPTDSTGRLTESAARLIAPYERLAKSSKPITLISGIADSADKIALVWATNDGESFSLRVDKDRNPIDEPKKLPVTLTADSKPNLVLDSGDKPILEYTDGTGQRTRLAIP